MHYFNPEEIVPEYLLNDPNAGYEKAEMDQLRAALKRTPEERFQMMTRLIKIGFMLKNAKVSHKPFVNKQ